MNLTQNSKQGYPSKISYLAENHPLPSTSKESVLDRIAIYFLASLFILTPLCYIPSSFVTILVKERISKAKHLQLASSISPYIYWISVLIWDLLLYTVLVLLIIIILFSFGSNSSQSLVGVKEGTYAVFILLITYGTSVLPLCYIYSMFFNNHSAAQISIMTINFGTGFIAVVTYFILFLGIRTKNIAILLVQFFRIFPTYNIGEGLINVTATFVQNTFLQTEVDYFEWNVAGKFFTFHSALSFFSVLCLFFYFFFSASFFFSSLIILTFFNLLSGTYFFYFILAPFFIFFNVTLY